MNLGSLREVSPNEVWKNPFFLTLWNLCPVLFPYYCGTLVQCGCWGGGLELTEDAGGTRAIKAGGVDSETVGTTQGVGKYLV